MMIHFLKIFKTEKKYTKDNINDVPRIDWMYIVDLKTNKIIKSLDDVRNEFYPIIAWHLYAHNT
jgi:hypothetical protein